MIFAVLRPSILGALQLGVVLGLFSPQELVDKIQGLQRVVEKAFDRAVQEPKISSREALVSSNSSPLVTVASITSTSSGLNGSRKNGQENIVVRSPWDTTGQKKGPGTGEVMRKLMTRVYDEILTQDKDTVYVGEDVEHGG